MRRIIFFWLCVAAFSAAASTIKTYPFHVETQKVGDEFHLVAVNGGPATMTLSAQIKGDNFRSDRSWPLTAVIRPNSSQKIARVFAATSGLAYQFSTRFSNYYGDLTTAPDLSVGYRLPFADGLIFPVGQAFGGEITTHTEADSRYAVDFTMPEKTKIVAARGGTVIEVQDGFTIGGQTPDLLDKANSIAIIHADGSVAHYLHLMPQGVLVREGQTVLVGQHIGYSGNTGYSSGPHLHFSVTRAVLKPDYTISAESVPVTFYAFNPPVRFSAQQDMTVSANYSTAAPPAPQIAVAVNQPRAIKTAAPGVVQQPKQLLEEPATSGIRIEAASMDNLQYWLAEVHRKTGYPWWIWLGLVIAGILILKLLATFTADRGYQRIEPSLEHKAGNYKHHKNDQQ